MTDIKIRKIDVPLNDNIGRTLYVVEEEIGENSVRMLGIYDSCETAFAVLKAYEQNLIYNKERKMTQEDKDLLLKDLCGRLPYGVKVVTKYGNFYDLRKKELLDKIINLDIMPYLRPMSSMTEEERKELLVYVIGEIGSKYFQIEDDGSIDNNAVAEQELLYFNLHLVNFNGDTTSRYLDWLNAHHFDYRGLIEKGLAIEATEGIYKEGEK